MNVARVRVWHTSRDSYTSRWLRSGDAVTGFLGLVVVYDEQWEPGKHRIDVFHGNSYVVFRDGRWQNADDVRDDDEHVFEGNLVADDVWAAVYDEMRDPRWGLAL